MKRLPMLLLFAPLACNAENYLLNGGQASEIRFEMVQDIIPGNGVAGLSMSYVVPQNFQSPCYVQTIQGFDVNFSVPPDATARSTDSRGNEVVCVDWRTPRNPIRAVLSFTATTRTILSPITTSAPFPVSRLPDEVRPYLASTKLVPSNRQDVREKALQLTSASRTQFDAVQRILSWIVDRVNYVAHPEKYDAVYSLTTGRGNCQNYSHLAALFMRAVGIPVRIVNGVTLKQPYEVKMPGGALSVRMAQGRHSWIEVYFPDLGWVPFDPQQMEMFVSNRFIRVEVGLDNEETINDGNVKWKRAPGSLAVPIFQEVVNARFMNDRADLAGERQSWGPRKLLFSPAVQGTFTRLALFHAEEEEAPSVESPGAAAAAFTRPDTIGNIEFPQNEDFLGVREVEKTGATDEFSMKKNFLVETAEYVTSKGERFGQAFLLDQSMSIDRIDLALHKFGGAGNLWVELARDDGSGKPGTLIETSEFVPVASMPGRAGYSWSAFPFARSKPRLEKGRYWILLSYSGSPVVNWFFTYGKPVGPNDGTRFNTMFDESWGNELAYEFNYRVIGKTAR
jgi:hypothetical protein